MNFFFCPWGLAAVGQRFFLSFAGGAIKNMKYGRLPDFDESGEIIEIPDDPNKGKARESAFARYMNNATFLIPTPQVLQKIITGLEDL